MKIRLQTIVLRMAPVAAFLALGSATPAAASSDSLLTLGVGTSMNLEGNSALTGTFKTRVRLLLGVGAELSYAPAEAGHDDATTGLHALIYLVPTSPVGGYVKAGYSNGQLGTIGTETDNYEIGGGVEVYLDDHFAVGAEYLRAFPNIDAIGESMMNGGDLWGAGQDVWSITLWWFT